MTVVKSLALGALVIATVAHPTTAAPSRPVNLRWLGWNSRGEVTASTPAPVILPVPVPGPTSVPFAFTPSLNAAAAPTARYVAPLPPPSAFAPSFNPTSTAESHPIPPKVSAPPTGVYDAFLNLTEGKFAEADDLTTGNPQAWYNSPVVQSAFGGMPDAAQRGQFTQDVLDEVKGTFERSGVPINLTTDPNAPAAHSLSVVSNASYQDDGKTIGITDVGRNGFTFIDKFGQYGSTGDLSTAVANNVAHELMHAFGIAAHRDKSGNYIDSAIASSSMLTDPSATFSPETVQDLLSRNFSDRVNSVGSLGGQLTDHAGQCRCSTCHARQTGPQTVPEPTTVALWLAVAGGAIVARSRRPVKVAA